MNIDIESAVDVLQRYKAGETIQCKHDTLWVDLHKPRFNFGLLKYRVKPEPEPVEFWMNVSPIANRNFDTKEEAEKFCIFGSRTILVREVIE